MIKKLFAVLTIVTGMSVGAFAQAGATGNSSTTTTTTTTPKAPASAVKFDQTMFNFGEMEYNSPVTHTFKFTNTSDKPIAIKDVGTSCGCTTPSYSKEPVAPGKTGEVTAKYDSSRIGGFNKTLTVSINDEQIKLVIAGTIKQPSSVTPPTGK